MGSISSDACCVVAVVEYCCFKITLFLHHETGISKNVNTIVTNKNTNTHTHTHKRKRKKTKKNTHAHNKKKKTV